MVQPSSFYASRIGLGSILAVMQVCAVSSFGFQTCAWADSGSVACVWICIILLSLVSLGLALKKFGYVDGEI